MQRDERIKLAKLVLASLPNEERAEALGGFLRYGPFQSVMGDLMYSTGDQEQEAAATRLVEVTGIYLRPLPPQHVSKRQQSSHDRRV